jgi:hypothetical protein
MLPRLFGRHLDANQTQKALRRGAPGAGIAVHVGLALFLWGTMARNRRR